MLGHLGSVNNIIIFHFGTNKYKITNYLSLSLSLSPRLFTSNSVRGYWLLCFLQTKLSLIIFWKDDRRGPILIFQTGTGANLKYSQLSCLYSEIIQGSEEKAQGEILLSF